MATKTKKEGDRIRAMIHEVEKLAKRLRADIRKRAAAVGLTKSLQAAAGELRKRAAAAAAQVEKYAHQVRKELETGTKPVKRAKPKRKKHKAVAPAAPAPTA